MGKGYSVLIYKSLVPGLNMVSPRLLVDDEGNNWWPAPGNSGDEQIVDIAVYERALPWLDTGSPPEDWEGGPKADYQWEVLVR